MCGFISSAVQCFYDKGENKEPNQNVQDLLGLGYNVLNEFNELEFSEQNFDSAF